jgi:protein ImuA
MQGLARQAALKTLRARIETLEKRPPLAAESPSAAARTGLFAFPAGHLHEVFTDTHSNAGASLGFALSLVRGLLSGERRAVLYLQLSHEAAETGLPYGVGIANFGVDPDALIFIRAETIIELLWAAEEALLCPAVAAVIADIGSDPKALDFTASRRLGLRAAAAKGTMLLLRYGTGRTASAARMRWHLMPAPSRARPFDAKAPGDSRWRVTLEKGWKHRPHAEWLLGWTKNGLDILNSPDGPLAAPPLPRALSSRLGDRLSKTA